MFINYRRSLAIVLLAGGLTVAISIIPAIAQPCLHDGDVNQDSVLTPEDARLALYHFLAIADPPLDACAQNQANVLDPDISGITPADALCIFQRFLNLASCLDDEDSEPPPLPPPPPPGFETFDLTGRWEGSWQLSLLPSSGTITVLFSQTDDMLIGAITVTGSPCLIFGTVEGTVDGTTVLIGGVFGRQDTTHFTGTIEPGGNRITGTYEVDGGLCNGDRGTWQLIRVE